jgi:hypothetical protein
MGALITDSVADGGDSSGWLRRTRIPPAMDYVITVGFAKPPSLSEINHRAERAGATQASACVSSFSGRLRSIDSALGTSVSAVADSRAAPSLSALPLHPGANVHRTLATLATS